MKIFDRHTSTEVRATNHFKQDQTKPINIDLVIILNGWIAFLYNIKTLLVWRKNIFYTNISNFYLPIVGVDINALTTQIAMNDSMVM